MAKFYQHKAKFNDKIVKKWPKLTPIQLKIAQINPMQTEIAKINFNPAKKDPKQSKIYQNDQN